MDSKKILCVGYLCLDLVTVCEVYPDEDSDQRCLDHRWQIGGNSANNSVVLGHLGENPDLLSNLADDSTLSFFKTKLSQIGVNTSECPILKQQKMSTSTVLVNNSNGSRTIMHFKGSFPELSIEAFKNLDLSKYSWIIFEARNLDVLPDMISHVRRTEPGVKISIEIEKRWEDMDQFLGLGDVVFVSKDFAWANGFNCKEEAVRELGKKSAVGSTVVCPWAEDGAAALVHGEVVSVPAVPPARVVDTLGAGDTFLSSTVLALSKGHNVKDSITFGCQVAGFKCGIPGFDGIREAKEKLLEILPRF